MSHVMCGAHLLAHKHLMVVTFIFTDCVTNCRVCISSLDTIGHGMIWQMILLCSNKIHVRRGLTSMLSHGFT